MPRPVVLVTRRLPASVVAILEQVADVEMNTRAAALSPEELRARVAGKQALVAMLTDRVDETLLDAGRELRIVANVAVGYDNIDVEAARRRGVVVTNTPDVLTEAVAELTWGLILAVTRRIVEGDRLVRAGRWKGWSFDFMWGTELGGRQLGIVGFGRIGRAVAARAPAFGMRVAATRRLSGAAPAEERSAGKPAAAPSTEGASDPATRSAAPGVEPAVTRMSLDELLATSDVVSIHAPLTPETRHLIDQKALARMKRTAYLVNTARGPIVDEEALAWALREGLIAGAALDVYEREPKVHPALLELENVVLAPHLGSATRETRTAMAELAAKNVVAVLSGRPPLTPVS
ncbi:MAG TPA: D-glycerate dehydrogenase [Vicinamibacterales bacterium]|nr:D-glycerate dehydrogenase [Vicinamibacterales bacterium]